MLWVINALYSKHKKISQTTFVIYIIGGLIFLYRFYLPIQFFHNFFEMQCPTANQGISNLDDCFHFLHNKLNLWVYLNKIICEEYQLI